MKEKTKVYTYTRVSTAMQIDGYSLEAQKNRMKAYADFNDYEIVGEYEDAGKLMISVLFAVAQIERENIHVRRAASRRPPRADGTAASRPTAMASSTGGWSSTRKMPKPSVCPFCFLILWPASDLSLPTRNILHNRPEISILCWILRLNMIY